MMAGLAGGLIASEQSLIDPNSFNQMRKTSIMVVEHNIRSILDVASRVYVLDKGKIAHDGTPSTVEESEILTKVFLGAVE